MEKPEKVICRTCPSGLICLARGENPWAAFICEECRHMVLILEEAGSMNIIEYHVSKISDRVLCDMSGDLDDPDEVEGIKFGEVCHRCLWKRDHEET